MQARLLLCLVVGACCCAAIAAIPMLRENWLYTALAYVAVCGRALAPDFLFQGKERMGPLTTRYLASKGLSTALAFAVFGGPAYASGAYVMRVVSPVLAFSFYGMFFGWPVLGAMGKVKQLTATTFASAAFGVAGLLVAWLAVGGTLAAFGVSRVLTEALMCGLRMGACWRALRETCY